MQRKRLRICGRNTSTLPVPALSPSSSSPRTGPAGSSAPSALLSAAMPELIQACGALAQLNTAWNMRNRTSPSSSGPATGFSTTASSFDNSASRAGTR